MIMSHPRIVNVVATGYLGAPLNLSEIVDKLDNVAYNPHKFGAAVYRLQDPKASFLLFSSGKFVCTGTTSVSMARDSAQRMVQSIQLVNQLPVSLTLFTIRNIVGTINIGFQINLEQFYDSKGANCIYEQEFFPGLKFRPIKKESKTVLVFISGKIVITGCKKEEEIPDMAYYMKRILLKFKR